MSESPAIEISDEYSEEQLASLGTVVDTALGHYTSEEWAKLGLERSASYSRRGKKFHVRKQPSDRQLKVALETLRIGDKPCKQKIFNEEGWLCGVKSFSLTHEGLQEKYDEVFPGEESASLPFVGSQNTTSTHQSIDDNSFAQSELSYSTISAFFDETFPSEKSSQCETDKTFLSSDATLSLNLYLDTTEETRPEGLEPLVNLHSVETLVGDKRCASETYKEKLHATPDVHRRSFSISTRASDMDFLESPIFNPSVILSRLPTSKIKKTQHPHSVSIDSTLSLEQPHEMSLISSLSPTSEPDKETKCTSESSTIDVASGIMEETHKKSESTIKDDSLVKISKILNNKELFPTKEMFASLTAIGRIPEVVAQSNDSFFLAVLTQLHRSGLFHDIDTAGKLRARVAANIMDEIEYFKVVAGQFLREHNTDLEQYVKKLRTLGNPVTSLDIFATAQFCKLPMFLISSTEKWVYDAPPIDKSHKVATNLVVLYNGLNGYLGSKTRHKPLSQRKQEAAEVPKSPPTSSTIPSKLTERQKTPLSSDRTKSSIYTRNKRKLHESKSVPRTRSTARKHTSSVSLRSSVSVDSKKPYVLKTPERQNIKHSLRSNQSSKPSSSDNNESVNKVRSSPRQCKSYVTKKVKTRVSSNLAVGSNLSVNIDECDKEALTEKASKQDSSSNLCSNLGEITTLDVSFRDQIDTSADSFDSSVETDYTHLNLSAYGSKDKEYFLQNTIRCIKHLKKKIRRLSQQKTRHCPRCGYKPDSSYGSASAPVETQTPEINKSLSGKPSASPLEASVPEKCHPSAEFPCDLCNRIYLDPTTLKEHRETHVIQKFRCNLCSKEFCQERTLRSHKLTHETGPLKCYVCEKEFNRKDKLQLHLAAHKGEFKFHCHECDKGFTTKNQLQQHLITHINDKPHVCKWCGKTYKRLQELNAHLEMKCENMQKFVCDEPGCNKAFISKRYLKAHSETHGEQQSIVCTKCGKNFKSRSGFWKHNKKEHPDDSD